MILYKLHKCISKSEDLGHPYDIIERLSLTHSFKNQTGPAGSTNSTGTGHSPSPIPIKDQIVHSKRSTPIESASSQSDR